jgi:hypothetical protein
MSSLYVIRCGERYFFCIVNTRVLCGGKLCLRDIRCTELTLMPMSRAIAPDVQCAVSPGRAVCVALTERHQSAFLPVRPGRFLLRGSQGLINPRRVTDLSSTISGESHRDVTERYIHCPGFCAPHWPRRGAPPKGEVSARERILATASELFYREGIRAIGVDTAPSGPACRRRASIAYLNPKTL